MRFDIPDSELHWKFSPTGGPGGQHANRSSTRVELRFHVEDSDAIPDDVRHRIVSSIGSEVTVVEDGSRSQALNRKRALRRLYATLEEAAKPPPPKRRRTRPSRAARQRRLDAKRARAETKRLRRRPGDG
jgi:ribosome-associated protein